MLLLTDAERISLIGRSRLIILHEGGVYTICQMLKL